MTIAQVIAIINSNVLCRKQQYGTPVAVSRSRSPRLSRNSSSFPLERGVKGSLTEALVSVSRLHSFPRVCFRSVKYDSITRNTKKHESLSRSSPEVRD